MFSTSSDYYAVLHVSRDAPLEIIRSSYRTLLQKLKHHPDLGGDSATAAAMNEAYAVLSDTDRRAEYDVYLLSMSQIAQGTPDSPINDIPVETPARTLSPFQECIFCELPHEHGRVIDDEADCRSCNSPLSPVKDQRLNSLQRRAVERFNKTRAITYFTDASQATGFDGETEDVSLSGLRFRTQQALKEGQLIKIVSEVLVAVANVTHCTFQRQGWGTMCFAGVEFVTLRMIRPRGSFVSRHV